MQARRDRALLAQRPAPHLRPLDAIAAFPDEIIAPTMGHADDKLSPEELRRRLLLHARAALPDCMLMHQSEPKSTEFPDRLDTLDRVTHRN